MMTDKIAHHLTDELLMAYSAGSISEAFGLVIATHISMCDECRARLGSYEAVGGEILEACGIADVSGMSVSDAIGRITDDDAAGPDVAPQGGFPVPLCHYAAEGPSGVRWRAVGMGVRQAPLAASREASARLLYIPAGAAVPDHGHRGRELTLVLQGAFRDEAGRYGPGDIEIADQDIEHRPVAEAGDPCICLAATDAPLRFRGLLPRLVQPFIRI